MEAILTALKETPLPTIFVVAGIGFLLLALAGQIAGKIEVPPARQKWAGFLGSLFLVIGIVLHTTPAPLPPSAPTPTVGTAGTALTLSPTLPPVAPAISIIAPSPTVALGASATITPLPTIAPAPQGVIESVWVDHNVVRNGQQGMLIHVDFTVQNLQQVPCQMIVYFYDHAGTRLDDQDGTYSTSDGQVTVYSAFTPAYPSTSYADFQLFMPYHELHVAGYRDLQFVVKVFEYGSNTFVTESAYISFWVQL